MPPKPWVATAPSSDSWLPACTSSWPAPLLATGAGRVLVPALTGAWVLARVSVAALSCTLPVAVVALP